MNKEEILSHRIHSLIEAKQAKIQSKPDLKVVHLFIITFDLSIILKHRTVKLSFKSFFVKNNKTIASKNLPRVPWKLKFNQTDWRNSRWRKALFSVNIKENNLYVLYIFNGFNKFNYEYAYYDKESLKSHNNINFPLPQLSLSKSLKAALWITLFIERVSPLIFRTWHEKEKSLYFSE